jgi:ankyrin repeat protein
MKRKQHHLESWLEEVIKEGEIEEIKQAIESIEHNQKASLIGCDEEDRNFIMQALQHRQGEIALLLLNKLQNTSSIMLAKDKAQKTLMIYAVQHQHVDIIKKLIQFGHQHHCKLWLEADSDGNTPLHHAVETWNETSIHLLMTEILKEHTAISIINQANADGDTVLHMLLGSPLINANIISYLINQGADWHIKNNDQVSPFHLLLKLSHETQIKIFNGLIDQHKKNSLLKYYREHLIKYPELTEMKEIYFQLSAKTSLLAFMLAQHEFNHHLPVRNTFQHPNGKEDFIPDFVGKMMPLYMKKVEKEEKKINVKNEIDIETNWTEIELSKNDYECVNQDREMITSLITDIQQHIIAIQNKPYSIKNRTAAVLISLSSIASFIATVTWLWIKEEEYNNKSDNYDDPNHYTYFHQWNDYLLGSLFTTIIGCGALIAFNLYVPGIIWDKEKIISSTTWKVLIERLQTDMIQQLEALEKNTQQKSDYFPVDATIINQLKIEIAQLEKNQSASQALQVLTQIKNILESIRVTLNKSNKPISLFFKPKETVLSITEESDDDENTHLLGNRFKQSRMCGIQ